MNDLPAIRPQDVSHLSPFPLSEKLCPQQDVRDLQIKAGAARGAERGILAQQDEERADELVRCALYAEAYAREQEREEHNG